MKTVGDNDAKKLKSCLISLFCFLTVANGAAQYLSEDKIVGNITVEHSVQTPAPVNNPPVAQPPVIEDQTKAEPKNEKININTSDSIQLQKLPGIGPTKSESIIAYREEFGGFRVIEEINEVKGIGDATYAKIKDFITVE